MDDKPESAYDERETPAYCSWQNRMDRDKNKLFYMIQYRKCSQSENGCMKIKIDQSWHRENSVTMNSTTNQRPCTNSLESTIHSFIVIVRRNCVLMEIELKDLYLYTCYFYF